MITYGADPEFACTLGDKVNGMYNIIPPAALIEDYGVPFEVNENNKRTLFSIDDIGRVIEDGAAIEINVDPRKNLSTVADNISNILQKFKYYLRNFKLDVIFPNVSVGYFDTDKYWKGRGESFRECVIFGCDPDFFPEYYLDIGLEKERPHEIDVSNHKFRYFGGHVHIGTETKFDKLFSPIVFDFTLGLVNSIFYRDRESRSLELTRLKYYGHPGRGRIQKHGYEYRPPSNYWISRGYDSCIVMESSIKLAKLIIDNDLQEEFFFFVKDDIPEMWDISLNLSAKRAKQLYIDTALNFCMKNNLIKISNLKNYTKFGYS